MDPLTFVIAQYVGPVILAVGLGIFFSKNYYTRVYRDLQNETLAVMMGGISILIAGIAIVVNHTIWDSFLAITISLIGWLSIVKGITLLIAPKMADRFGNKVADTALFPIAASLATALGAYISYMAYFA